MVDKMNHGVLNRLAEGLDLMFICVVYRVFEHRGEVRAVAWYAWTDGGCNVWESIIDSVGEGCAPVLRLRHGATEKGFRWLNTGLGCSGRGDLDLGTRLGAVLGRGNLEILGLGVIIGKDLVGFT